MSTSGSVTMESIDNSFLKSSNAKSPSESSFGPTGKRLDYITWHQHHMYMARMLSEMSDSDEKEPSGCYIVDQEHYQIASGFSGESSTSPCQHAISIAIEKLKTKKIASKNCTIYITAFPTCPECVQRIQNLDADKIWFWLDSEAAECPEIPEKFEKYIPTRQISIDFSN